MNLPVCPVKVGDSSGSDPVCEPAAQNEHLDMLLFEQERKFRVETLTHLPSAMIIPEN